jgi:hypothetical protein
MSHKVAGELIIPSERAAQLSRYCPDLANWPQSWSFDDPDLPPGRSIVQCLTPFLLHLLEQQLAAKTLRKHRDNLWLLGGELIRERYDDDQLMQLPIDQLIGNRIDDEGGPLIYPRITESAQESFDATCRKLHRFLNQP